MALWTAQDLAVALSQDYATPGEAEIVPSADFKSCTFSFTAEEAPSYTFYAMSPATAATAISPSRKSWLVTIPATQTPLEGSCDEHAQILAASSSTLYDLPSELDIHFSHVTAYGKLSFKNLDLSGATVSSISLVSSAPIAGSWYYDIEKGELTAKEGSYSLNLNTSRTENIWFAWAPVDLSGTTLKVVVHTDKGNFTKTVTFPANRVLTPGKIASFSVNMSGIEAEEVTNTVTETVFQKVTALSDLAAGDEIILVNPVATPTFAMTSTASSTSGLSAVASSADTGFKVGSDGFIRLPNDSKVMVLTIANKGTSSLRLRNSAGNYLYSASSGSGFNATRYLSLSTSYTDWTGSFTSGQASLRASSGSRSYYITYGSNYFNISTSSGYLFVYKKTTSTTEVGLPEDDAVTDYEEYGAYIVGNPMIYSPTTDQISREYSDGTVTFTILDPVNDTCLEFAGAPANASLGDSFTLTLTQTAGLKETIFGSFSVTVIKEEGSRLWLSDGNGNSFIIKR